MRKNLYRAKGADDADKNVWYEGYYMQMNDTTYCFSEDYERAAREGKDPRHYYIVFDRMTDWGLPNRHFKADVRPETLCQHTGRYDKNKKSIYNKLSKKGKELIKPYYDASKMILSPKITE